MLGCSLAQPEGERVCYTPTPESIRIPENVRISYAPGEMWMLSPVFKGTMYFKFLL